MLSLQIVEESQVNLDDSRMRDIWHDSKLAVNPVEIIISTEGYLETNLILIITLIKI